MFAKIRHTIYETMSLTSNESARGIEMKTTMTMDELDALYERIGSNSFRAYDWWPTVEELKTYVEPHPEPFIEFLIWILETADDPETPEEEESKKYINRLLIKLLKIKD